MSRLEQSRCESRGELRNLTREQAVAALENIHDVLWPENQAEAVAEWDSGTVDAVAAVVREAVEVAG